MDRQQRSPFVFEKLHRIVQTSQMDISCRDLLYFRTQLQNESKCNTKAGKHRQQKCNWWYHASIATPLCVHCECTLYMCIWFVVLRCVKRKNSIEFCLLWSHCDLSEWCVCLRAMHLRREPISFEKQIGYIASLALIYMKISFYRANVWMQSSHFVSWENSFHRFFSASTDNWWLFVKNCCS